jgi:TatD DNase family protein
MITVGCTLEDSHLAISCADEFDPVFASIGIHPHEAKHFLQNKDNFNDFAKLLKNKNKIVAIGECGLDYYYELSKKDDQEKVLRFQLELALEYDLPITFHVREAFDDFWPILDDYRDIKGVLHSFTDNQINLEKALERGLSIGINGIATFTKDQTQTELFKSLPLKHILLETDSPYLTPAPHRGTMNRPAFVGAVGSYLAQLKGIEAGEMAYATTQNAKKLFKKL